MTTINFFTLISHNLMIIEQAAPWLSIYFALCVIVALSLIVIRNGVYEVCALLFCAPGFVMLAACALAALDTLGLLHG